MEKFTFTTRKIRKGDIYFIPDSHSEGAKWHPCVVISETYSTASISGSHSVRVQCMKLTSASNGVPELGVPVVLMGNISYIVPSNMYSIHINEFMPNQFKGFIDEDTIDLLLQLYFMRLSKKSMSEMSDLNKLYHQYISDFDNFVAVNGTNQPDTNKIPSKLAMGAKKRSDNNLVVTKVPPVSYDVNLAVHEFENVITSPNPVISAQPKFLKTWTTKNLLLLYFLYNTDKKLSMKLYRYNNENSFFYRYKSALEELDRRGVSVSMDLLNSIK